MILQHKDSYLQIDSYFFMKSCDIFVWKVLFLTYMIFLFFCTEMAFHSKGSLAGILNSLHLMLLTHMMKCLLLGVDQTRYKEIFEIHNFQLFAFVVWTSAKYSNRFEYGLQMKLNDMRDYENISQINPNLPWDFYLNIAIATYLCFYAKSRALVISGKTHWMIYISNFDPTYSSNRNEAWNNVGLLQFFNIFWIFQFCSYNVNILINQFTLQFDILRSWKLNKKIINFYEWTYIPG